MESFYLVDYIKKNPKIDSNYIDVLKYELDKRIYYYGDQFKYPFEKSKKNVKDFVRYYLITGYTLGKILQNGNKEFQKDCILSTAYFTVNQELSKMGYEVFCPSWSMTRDGNVFPDIKLYKAAKKLKSILDKSNFHQLINEEFITKIEEIEKIIISAFQRNKIKAVIVSNDLGFFENILINVCKKTGIPSFIFLHGLPGRYNILDDNLTDYLIVWGEKIKENYIKYGFNRNKLIVSGHPYYQESIQVPLKFSLENILVLTKSMCGGQHRDKVRLADRGNLVLYLLSIEKVLRITGIRNVRLRPHPSEDVNWYFQFISKEFFTIDNSKLEESITNSTLVIGPTSTVFLESIYHGRNYLVYEPSVEGLDIFKFELIPPFDKSDSKVPVATNENEFEYFIKNKIMVDPTCFNDYISTPFDLSFVKNLIK